MKKFLLFILLTFSPFSVFAADTVCWHSSIMECFSNPQDACTRIMSNNTCDKSQNTYYMSSSGYIGSDLCKVEYMNCVGNPVVYDGGTMGVVLSCSNGFLRVGDECVCMAPKGIYDGKCQTCPSEFHLNSSTGLCERECEYPLEYVAASDSCMLPCDPGYVRKDNGWCVLDCDYSTQEDINGQCRDLCPQGASRDEFLNCTCPPDTTLLGGSCVPFCREGYVLDDNNQCVRKPCGEGEEYSFILKRCVPDFNDCPAGQHREGLLCVNDNDDSCPKNTHWEQDCDRCVPDGSPIGVCGSKPGDMDGDGDPDSTDPDIDGDGNPNSSDDDSDGDGIPNSQDNDDDNDGIPDNNDLTPQGPGTSNNSHCVGPSCDDDGDGIPNSQDDDDDGDGILDNQEEEKVGSVGEGLGDLYEPSGETLSSVWGEFLSKLNSSPVVYSTASFFDLGSISATCPVFILPATIFYPAISIDFMCHSSIRAGLEIAGYVMLIIAAWVAFYIAFM